MITDETTAIVINKNLKKTLTEIRSYFYKNVF